MLPSICSSEYSRRKYPKATECLLKDRDELLTFYDFLAQHWQSIRTSNPTESAFATIQNRTKRTQRCLSRDGMLHVMFKLGQCAKKSWRKLRGFAHLADVIKGVDFVNGINPRSSRRMMIAWTPARFFIKPAQIFPQVWCPNNIWKNHIKPKKASALSRRGSNHLSMKT